MTYPDLNRIITYSPAYTIVPTYECFNRCTYCNFRVDPGQDRWLSLAAAQSQLMPLKAAGMIEILILSGEVHPHSPRRQDWFEHIYALSELALSLGFLPHTNAGPLSFAEMNRLRQVNVSIGLMLEQVTALPVHQHAPSKLASLRLEQLEWAGQLQIPFTTGLLLGIGEAEADWRQTLLAIADSHTRWGQIQEVILQPYSPGDQEIRSAPGFPIEQLPAVVAIARQLLPTEITLQIPPNLIPQPELLLACLRAGARDLGGIGPLDHVNPSYPHLHLHALQDLLASEGWQLQPRLPVYPQGDRQLPVHLKSAVQTWRNDLSRWAEQQVSQPSKAQRV
ncbi:MAG: 7,8-didemethyl-8-hydroxy-5-deazariboflavin synthase subunit CofG [Aphanocapsa sp. GSE-SYN-MK-11-07L]|jgi:FO synthase subunit 1|nr:7,8-didemethyl-8-hydroxy-5-deazariboflavin synthase subunit CofG [Aphanocapsa sp. GSE-SYN-MK-11-07L]